MIILPDTIDYPESDGWLSVLAPAKVNLFLHITAQRDDGYHELESLFAFADFGDVVRVRKADQLLLEVGGPFSSDLPVGEGAEQGNLVIKAAQVLKSYCDSANAGAQIILDKNLPVAAGIGGGSADGAATLLALNQIWGTQLGLDVLAEVGLSLGADVPACLLGETAFVSGIGENVKPTGPIAPMPVVLVNPGTALATARVFEAYGQKNENFTKPLNSRDNFETGAMMDGLSGLRNDLQNPASGLVQEIGDVLQLLAAQAGCRLARMSGSGATCFGLFESDEAADGAITKIASARPHWWAQSGALGK